MSTILVTGGGAGIGAGICRGAAAAGWDVVCLDVNEAGVSAVAAETGGRGVAVSVTDEDAVGGVIAEIGGDLGAVVNCAGLVRFGPMLDLSLDDWRASVEVNLTGTFIVARAAARSMMERGGSIVNIGSMNGVQPGPYAGSYGSTKAGVHLLTQQMAIEWAPTIRVNAVAPGLINAGMGEPLYADAQIKAQREGAVPLGRLGTADDIANAVVWLCSDQAAYVTGQTVLVDGGVTMSIIANLHRPAAIDGVGAGE